MSRARSPPSPTAEMVTMPLSSTLISRSEEHTSELQSQSNLVCRLLLEKKKLSAATARSESKRLSPRQALKRSREGYNTHVPYPSRTKWNPVLSNDTSTSRGLCSPDCLA